MRFVKVFILLLLLPAASNAGIILTLEGTSGSSDFTLTASGSMTHTGSVAGNNQGAWARVPITSGSWYAPTSRWPSSIFTSTRTDSISGTSGAITWSVSGGLNQTNVYRDVFAFNVYTPFMIGAQDWGSVAANESIELTASGSIEFTDTAYTFDDFAVGTYTFGELSVVTQDTLQFVVKAASVPEPSILMLMLLGALGLVGSRRLSV